MIKTYRITPELRNPYIDNNYTAQLDLISEINRDFFNKSVSTEDIKQAWDEYKAAREKGVISENPPVIFNVQRDRTLSTRFDLVDKLGTIPSHLRTGEEKGTYDTTMRFKRNSETGEVIVRIPPQHNRIPLYKNNKLVPENSVGHLVQLDNFVICHFGDVDAVLDDSGCRSKTIQVRKEKFQDIYGKIKPDDIISVYLISHFVDERYWFDYINSRKTA